ncbi:MAG: hypothetical protein ASUL_07854 [Candidatus Aramenus sulfurataquae]|jgi:hypothetical protein|uniref:Uncharacterized protein n=2 Tax=Candidatus Aramenus sulfurataquae TaxID=1326980 RepID=W7KHH5_9CREN|nr:MAG: hypothetical protein ASUL_07854 [Candidatus Aramenus sulfurataquae]MCL7344445.1 hypothetical protein [Candidatus Aramenus sulfurataquae]
MDLKSTQRVTLLAGSVLYSLNVILSISLFTLLIISPLPVSNLDARAILTAVPLISGVFNALILALLSMSLKYAEYYGIAKSFLALIIYSGYWLAFKPGFDVLALIIPIMALCVAQIGVLYLYARVIKELFG